MAVACPDTLFSPTCIHDESTCRVSRGCAVPGSPPPAGRTWLEPAQLGQGTQHQLGKHQFLLSGADGKRLGQSTKFQPEQPQTRLCLSVDTMRHCGEVPTNGALPETQT